MNRRIKEIRNGLHHGPIRSYVSNANLASLNPFVLWDHFSMRTTKPAGFGFHGHSGVATITYPLIGEIDHQDTGGHSGKLNAGGVQVMSSGAGVLHKELVYPHQGFADAMQLWVALPSNIQEMGKVTYSTSEQSQLPFIQIDGAKVTSIIGSYKGNKSPIIAPVEMTYLKIQLEQNKIWHFKVPHAQTTAFIYIRQGKLASDKSQINQGQFGIFEVSDNEIAIKSLTHNSEFLFVAGKPLEQKIISNGSSIHSSNENLSAGVMQIKKLHKQILETEMLNTTKTFI